MMFFLSQFYETIVRYERFFATETQYIPGTIVSCTYMIVEYMMRYSMLVVYLCGVNYCSYIHTYL